MEWSKLKNIILLILALTNLFLLLMAASQEFQARLTVLCGPTGVAGQRQPEAESPAGRGFPD